MSGSGPKTDTIKQRRVDVYLPSLETKNRWSEIAEQRGESLSKFVINTIEDFLNEGDDDHESRQELLEENRALKEKVKELERDIKVYRKGYTKLEGELKEYREQWAKAFIKPKGGRQLSTELIALLKQEQFIRFEDIYELLDIEPSDTDVINAFQEQLKVLEAYGLIKEEKRGWRWRG